MKHYQIHRQVLSFSGIFGQVEKFLNGLTANSLDKPHNAFVNLHGRIIATFDQLKVSDEQFLLVVEHSFVPQILEHVDRFAKLSHINIEKEDLKVFFDLNASYSIGEGEFIIAQKKGFLILTSNSLPINVINEEFTLFRLKNNIPFLGIDYKDEMLLNVSETDFVSFTKGCFLGQEPIAKVHHRSRPTWKLVVRYEDECSVEEKVKMTSKVSEPSTGRVLGFVFVANK